MKTLSTFERIISKQGEEDSRDDEPKSKPKRRKHVFK